MLTVLVVALALGALSASAAMAHEWKVSGNPVISPTKAESEGTLQFENTTEQYSFQCKFRRKVELEPGGLGEITSITSTSGAKVLKCETKTSSACEKEAEIEALHLPWRTELVTINGELRNKIVKGGGQPEWKITCFLFRIKTPNWCYATTNAGIKNSGSLVEEIYDAKSPHTLCTNDGGEPFVTKGTELLVSTSGGVSAS
ncbi:MAG TPA: hypothetical protein VGL57_06940 [Solirubrobacteraceae bacterium]|jgi:hypothetical protein